MLTLCYTEITQWLKSRQAKKSINAWRIRTFPPTGVALDISPPLRIIPPINPAFDIKLGSGSRLASFITFHHVVEHWGSVEEPPEDRGHVIDVDRLMLLHATFHEPAQLCAIDPSLLLVHICGTIYHFIYVTWNYRFPSFAGY